MTDIPAKERKQMELRETLQVLFEPEGFQCRFMEPMSSHTTFRIGGPAAAYVCPAGEAELKNIITLCKREEIPFCILGNGSNLLVSDAGYEGVVISMTEGLTRLEAEGERIFAASGQLLSRTAKKALEEGLTGLEFAAGIPGTIGGALVMNAGAYGSEMKDVLEYARVMTPEGEILTLGPEELKLGYRTSCIPAMGYTVLEACFRLKKGNREEIEAYMNELSSRRREKQPLQYPSAGSTFKRPEGYFAAKLIEDAGLKGFAVGGAQVSEKHSGFVINRGGATAADIMELCGQIKERVKAQFDVELEMEVKTLGKF